MKIALPRSPETQQRERLRNLRLGAAAITSTIQEACHRGRTEGMPNVALPLQQAEGIRQTAQSLCALAVQIDAHERGVRRASAHLLVLEFTAELAGFAGVIATLVVKWLFFADEFPSESAQRRACPGLPHHRRKGTLT